MTIEASLYTPTQPVVPQGVERFVRDVDAILEALSAVLRRSPRATEPSSLPTEVPIDLRNDQRVMLQSVVSSGRPAPPLLMETERITNSLNTMADLMRRTGSHSLPTPRRFQRRGGIGNFA
jgi:hypothetical protein